MENTKFYFGRLIFKHQLTGIEDFTGDGEFDKVGRIRSLLEQYISEDEPVYRDDEEIWRFGRYDTHDGLIFGKFGKVYGEQPMQFDDDVGDFVESPEDEEMADVSYFIIYPEENVIAFNRKKRIGQNQFAEAFAQGYNNVQGIPDGMEVKLLKNSMDIQRVLESADKVFSVEFDLVPTNPIRDENMRTLDEPMNDMGADELIFSPHADNGSLNSDSPYIQSGFALSNNGYGDFEMEYEVDDENKIYNSRNRAARYETEKPDGLGGLRARADEIYERVDQLTVGHEDEESTSDP